MVNKINRRSFLKCSATAGAGLIILPSGSLLGANAPSNKLNIALIGAHGRGMQHWNSISSENIVAICDVHGKNLDLAAERFPKAKKYFDWRKCLDHKGIDAVNTLRSQVRCNYSVTRIEATGKAWTRVEYQGVIPGLHYSSQSLPHIQ